MLRRELQREKGSKGENRGTDRRKRQGEREREEGTLVVTRRRFFLLAFNLQSSFRVARKLELSGKKFRALSTHIEILKMKHSTRDKINASAAR